MEYGRGDPARTTSMPPIRCVGAVRPFDRYFLTGQGNMQMHPGQHRFSGGVHLSPPPPPGLVTFLGDVLPVGFFGGAAVPGAGAAPPAPIAFLANAGPDNAMRIAALAAKILKRRRAFISVPLVLSEHPPPSRLDFHGLMSSPARGTMYRRRM
jgi:hypothetical protein